MIFTFLGVLIAIFFVMSVPALVTKVTTTPIMVRNISVAVFFAVWFSLLQLGGPIGLFIAGVLACGTLAVIERRSGAKLLLLEPALIFCLIAFVIFLKGDAGGLFAGRGLGPTISHVEGVLYKHHLPIRAEHAGLFSFGGLLGLLAGIQLRPVILKWINRQSYLRMLRQRRALPEASVFGEKFAPWRLLMRSRRKLAARINRVTLR